MFVGQSRNLRDGGQETGWGRSVPTIFHRIERISRWITGPNLHDQIDDDYVHT